MMGTSSLQRLVVQAGSLAAQKGNPASTVELQGGTLWDDAQATSHAIDVPEGKSATWQLTYTYYTAYANKLTGKGTLTVVPRNTVQRVRITGNWSEFEGTVQHTNKDIILPLDNAYGMPKGTLNIAEGCSVSNVAKSYTIGKLLGKGQLIQPVANFQNQSAVNGSNTWNVGNSFEENGDFTFNGTFADSGGSNKCIFNKVGTCKMSVNGKSTHSGATTVKEGELCVRSGAQLGTGALSVQKGAMLSGVSSSTVSLTNSSFSIADGGTLRVGLLATSTTGFMNFGGKNVSFAIGSKLRLGAISKTSSGCTYLQNIGTLTMNGTVEIYVPETHSFAVGDSIVIWKNVTTVAGTPTIGNTVIDASKGLYWDAKDLSKGILRVAYDPSLGVRTLMFDPSHPDAVYDLNGRRVADEYSSNLKKGIYLYKGKKIVVR
jgi:hypothetical protein